MLSIGIYCKNVLVYFCVIIYNGNMKALEEALSAQVCSCFFSICIIENVYVMSILDICAVIGEQSIIIDETMQVQIQHKLDYNIKTLKLFLIEL